MYNFPQFIKLPLPYLGIKLLTLNGWVNIYSFLGSKLSLSGVQKCYRSRIS